jgi:hypothetical protein
VPARIPALFGSDCPTGDARTEIRAVYGGFGVVAAAAIAWAGITDTTTARGVLIGFAIALGGMTLGRTIGFAIDRSASLHPTATFLVIEVAAAAALLAASR